MPRNSFRVEHDFLGAVQVPRDALYGAQTQRALDNFPLSGERSIGDYPVLIEALLRIKWAAAEANRTAGLLDAEVAGAIVRGARELIDEGACRHFPIHRLHGGGGTSANMNANEVLANRAVEILGGAGASTVGSIPTTTSTSTSPPTTSTPPPAAWP